MYGYQIVQEIAARSGGTIVTQEGSLYPVLVRVRREDGVSVQAGCEGDASVLHRVGLPDRLERVVDVLPLAVRVLMVDRHVILPVSYTHLDVYKRQL